ncbi:MAG TPA: AI-2E family transporter, partial [Polyangiales bacterium]|nr:AI-2E family transporter [Polyangiales bacterium]
MFTAAGAWRTWLWLLGLLLLGLLIYALRAVLWPIFFAWLLAYMLDPLVDRLEAVRIPRGFGIAILLAGAITLLTLFVLLVLPAIVRDFIELGQALYQGFIGALHNLGPWLRGHRIPVPDDAEAALASVGAKAFGLAPSALGPVGGALEAALGSGAALLAALGTFVMVPVFSFYFLYDFDRMIAAIRELLPATIKPQVVAMASEVNLVLGHFVRGQLTVMGILAALYAGGYMLVGVPLALPISLLAGLLSFIPYVGSSVALLCSLLMVVLHFESWTQVLATAAVYAVVQT